MPVGPDPAEPARLSDLLDALAAFEAVDALVLVDDAPAPRELPAGGFAARVLRTGADTAAADFYAPMVAGTLAGLRAARDCDLLVKLDTDALVVGPFVDALGEAMGRSPRAGVFGSYDRTCTGAPRDFGVWRRPVRRLARPVLLRRRAPFVEAVPRDVRRRRREVLAAARANGYVDGEHCLGGAYAVRGALVRELDERGWLDARPWVGMWLGEDIVVGLLARACGYGFAGLVGTGEPFGLARAGLPAPPEDLLAAGHAIVHSIKGDDEERLRAWFRSRRRSSRHDSADLPAGRGGGAGPGDAGAG